ncbi:MAG: stress response protein [Chloroflexi bacterium]|nr:stress response protein [Chloroflexota bacterium]
MSDENWHEARLIPISGIKGAEEQERRGTSALLAVLTTVHEFERELLKPLGAPSGKVSAFCEVPFELADGRKVRVDGAIRVVRGKRTWTLLVEVKTGKAELGQEQVEAYLDVVKQEGFDGLLTISNQLVPVYGQHPVEVNKVRYRRTPLHHLSWSRILSTALRANDHIGIEDPEQDWILSELIRYLQYDGSGAKAFDDMGPDWTALRANIREGTLTRGDPEAASVAMRWEQLLQHISLSLAARLGGDVHPVLTRKEAQDPALRTNALTRELTDQGTLSGAIAIPNAIAPLAVSADLKSMVASVAVTLDAPGLARSTARLNWLLRQLRSAPDSLRLDAAFERTQFGDSELLGVVRGDSKTLLGGTDRLPRSFSVVETRKVSSKRRTGSGSFVSDVEKLVDEFYREVVQGLKTWTPPAPRLAEEKTESAEEHTRAEAETEAPAAGS